MIRIICKKVSYQTILSKGPAHHHNMGNLQKRAYLTFFFARGHTIWMIQIIRQKVSYQTMLFPKGRPIQMIWVICKKMAYFTVLFARGQPIQIIPVNYLQTDTFFYCSTNLEMKGEIIFLGHVVISLKKDLKPITLSNFEVADLYFLRNFKGEE